MRYAIVKNSLVTNMVEWDGTSNYSADGELILADENAWKGGEYNGSFIHKPLDPDPELTAEERQAQADKESGNQKLVDLGLTDAEIKALTGN